MSNLNKVKHQFSVANRFVNNIFDEASQNNERIFQLFEYQYRQNSIYQNWCKALNVTPGTINCIEHIPFLPVSFFKTHKVVCGEFEPQIIFESSGTTNTINSRHYIKDVSIYRRSFIKTFEQFYGAVKNRCIIGLLPSYLERENSSLVMMVNELIQSSQNSLSGFYLNDFDKLTKVLQQSEAMQQQTLLIGVTFALLDFAETHPLQLKHTAVMETGGMKGRRKELTRAEVHAILIKQLGISTVHSEYGMTELLSQAYSKGEGLFNCPPWMKVLVRDEEDPLSITTSGSGVLNIIDMANIYSCSFLATDDAGTVHKDGSFTVRGRLDNSDIRGCSLLAV